MGGLATATATALSLAILWVATQTDVLTVASGAAGDQLRTLLSAATRGLLTTMFGDQMFAVIQRMGAVGITAGLAGVAVAAGGSIAGLRALATASSRRRV
jgi:hypothetical protein